MPPEFDSRIKLLQFIHRLYTDGDFQKKFKGDPEGAMTDYELTSDMKTAIYHSGVDPTFIDANGDPKAASWWKEYALYKEDHTKPYPPRQNYVGVERPEGETASMGGVTALLIQELCGKDQFQEAW